MGNQAESVAAAGLRRDVDRDVVQAWLDALSSGACAEEAFLRAVQKLTRRSAEAGWDSLALIDQYYRRGKLSAELFNSLKARLGSELVGQGTSGEMSVPLPQQESPAIEPPPPPPPPPPSAPPPRPTLAIADQTVVLRAEPAPPPAAANESIPVAAPAFPAEKPTVLVRVREQRESAPVPVEAWSPSPAETSARRRGELPITQPNASARAETRRAARREIAVGDLLRGRYQIKSVLGRGGTGMVFEAADLYRIDMPDSGQRVALKVLHTLTGKPGRITELQREFQLLQSLSHPNIIRAHDYDRDGDLAFFTMEYLRGLSLVGVLSARDQVPLERGHALTIIRDVGTALSHAHSRSVIHGDLNPGNIFVTNDGEVRVLDFGASHPPSSGPVVSPSQSEQVPVATPRYASPQVLDGKRADVRDDLYALACIAYQLIAGKHPFAEQTALIAQEQRLKPSRPSGLSYKEWQALRAALAFDRERRPADVAGWLSAFDWRKAAPRLPVLLALVRVTPQKRSSSVLPAVVIAAAVLLAVGLWINHTSHQESSPPPSAELAAPSSDGDGASVAAPNSTASSEAATGTVQPAAPTASSEHAARAPAADEPPENASAVKPASAAPAPPPVMAGTAPVQSSTQTQSAGGAAAASSDAVLARTRIELAADTIDVPLTDPAARVIVRRKGSLRGATTFTWWTESGTAKPGTDFMAVAPHQEVIEDGKSSVNLFIPVVGDSTRQQPKSFYVVINDPGDGATLGARTLTMVTIPPSE
jgi:serine/threonine protein kinase